MNAKNAMLTQGNIPTDDLREFYITPSYLQTMKIRAQEWTGSFIQEQIKLFDKTIHEYPEVKELLEGELHRRLLNDVRRKARKYTLTDLEKYKRQFKDPDTIEVIETEIEIKKGMKKLTDKSSGKATVVA